MVNSAKPAEPRSIEAVREHLADVTLILAVAFGFPAGLVMLVLCLLTVWAAFLGTQHGFLHPDIDFNMYVASSSWISKIAVFTLLSSLILGLMALVKQWLNRSMTRMAAEIKDRKAAELELENAVAEKDTLLREIHHRVKTNLQIVKELVSNFLRHAFPGGRKGEIKVTFKQLEEEDYLLEVSDNGIGIPEGFDFNQTGTPGLQLITSIAGQLGAYIQQGEEEGTSFTLRFKEYFEVGAQI